MTPWRFSSSSKPRDGYLLINFSPYNGRVEFYHCRFMSHGYERVLWVHAWWKEGGGGNGCFPWELDWSYPFMGGPGELLNPDQTSKGKQPAWLLFQSIILIFALTVSDCNGRQAPPPALKGTLSPGLALHVEGSKLSSLCLPLVRYRIRKYITVPYCKYANKGL